MTSKQFDAITPFLGGICMFLAAIEYLIPKPIPFFRLGIANIPIIIALGVLPFRSYSILVIMKVLGQAIVNGTLASYVFIFSVLGTFSSAMGMWLLSNLFKKNISMVGISIFGALLSNSIQILFSILFIFGPASWLMAPPLLITGLVSGTAIGLFAEHFKKKSRWYKEVFS